MTFGGTKGLTFTILVSTIPFECPIAVSLSQDRRRSQRGQDEGKRMMLLPREVSAMLQAPALSLQLLSFLQYNPKAMSQIPLHAPGTRYGIFYNLLSPISVFLSHTIALGWWWWPYLHILKGMKELRVRRNPCCIPVSTCTIQKNNYRREAPGQNLKTKLSLLIPLLAVSIKVF